jgi:hypothetical protein
MPVSFEFSYVKSFSYNVAAKCLDLVYLTTRMLPEIACEILIQTILVTLSFVDYKYAKRKYFYKTKKGSLPG